MKHIWTSTPYPKEPLPLLARVCNSCKCAEKAEDWMYSSQRNYSGLENLLEIDEADI